MTTEIQEYTETEAGLAKLREKYSAVVFDVTKPKEMVAAKEARAELRTLRVALEKKRVEIKLPALQRCRLIDDEAKRITAELSKLEDPIDETIKAEEGRKEAERIESARLAELAARELRTKLDAIRARPLQVIGKPAEAIRAAVEETRALTVDGFPEHLQAEATQVRDEAVARLVDMHTERVAADVEAGRLAAERAELERLRQQQETERVERERISAEARQRDEAERKAARDKQDVELRAQREEQERVLAADRKRMADEETERQRVAGLERERLDNERRELDRQREATAQAERDRIAAERRQIEADRAEAERKARESAIANADLIASAGEAVELLNDSGFGEHIVTLKLAAALAREANRLEKAA